MPKGKWVMIRSVGRLSVYRRFLAEIDRRGQRQVYSHELAGLAQTTPAQVRRDLMNVGGTGTPSKGYSVPDLLQNLAAYLDAEQRETIALVGIGYLGRALLGHFAGRHPKLHIAAAFDVDPGKTDGMIHGCPCYHLQQLGEITREQNIHLGIIAVPADAAQQVAEKMRECDIRAILNFSPGRLNLPAGIYVEDIDVTVAIERMAFFARRKNTHNQRNMNHAGCQ